MKPEEIMTVDAEPEEKEITTADAEPEEKEITTADAEPEEKEITTADAGKEITTGMMTADADRSAMSHAWIKDLLFLFPGRGPAAVKELRARNKMQKQLNNYFM